MGLSKLSAKCRACPRSDKCDHKRMEAFGYLPELHLAEAAQLATSSAAAPILRDTVEIHMYGQPVTMYRDDLEREIRRELYGGFGLLMSAT